MMRIGRIATRRFSFKRNELGAFQSRFGARNTIEPCRWYQTISGPESAASDQGLSNVYGTLSGAAGQSNTEAATATTEKEKDAGILWLENIFPYRHPLIDPRAAWIERYSGKYMLNQRYEQYIPPEFKTGEKFKITNAQQNLKEGGIYLRFTYKGGNIKEAVEKIQNHVKEVSSPLIFDFLKVRAYQVKGTPWVEDLVSRVPTNRLHVQFLGPDLTVEDLYQEFRVFGRIMDISLQPSTDKEVPRYASVHFLHKRSATSARNCIHGERFGDTRLLIGYEKISHWWQRFGSWFNKNTRVAALIILGILASASYAIFDPWREFSIRNHVTGRFKTDEYTRSIYRFIDTAKALIDRLIGTSLFVREPKQSTVLQDWGTRKEKQLDLENNIKQAPTFPILVYGPRGSGKTRFVKDAIQKSKYQLYLNCEDLVGKGDNYLIRSLATQVNFFPTFNFLGQLGGIFDALITATTGAKSNMATTIEGEVKKILECVTLSLESITEAQNQLKSKILSTAISGEGPDGVRSDVEYPVLVIDGFLSKEYSNESYIYQHLIDWAAQLAVTESPATLQMLEKALPTKFVDQVSLQDALPEESLFYLKKRIGDIHKLDNPELYSKVLGGRLNDLETFSAKVLTGLDPDAAISQMIKRAMAEVRKIGFGEQSGWTNIQFWKIVQLLGTNEEVSFDKVVVNSLFGSNPEPLIQLERSGLISLNYENGRPYSIKSSRPLYSTTFREMLADDQLVTFMELQTAKHFYQHYQKKVRDYEQELETLSRIASTDSNVFSFGAFTRKTPLDLRAKWLMDMIDYYSQKTAANMALAQKCEKVLKV